MILKHLKLSLLLFLCLGHTGLKAQNAISATGVNASGSGGSVGYSIGQVIYTTNAGSSDSVAQGVQQPYEISVISGMEEFKEINLMVTAYPNPTIESFKLNVDASTSLNIQLLSYQLYDMNGKLLTSKKIEGNISSIIVRNLPPATYILKVLKNNQEIKNFKIIKY